MSTKLEVEDVEIFECPAIDRLVESSKILDNGELVDENSRLRWIPYSEFTDIETIEHPSEQIIYNAQHKLAGKDTHLSLIKYTFTSSDVLPRGKITMKMTAQR
ncbi:10390_t:CDS:2 [Paraglomus brasilianum]|uniref:10390_t:CDS:1 n=1 Tax=Paraglomus brasilianum TaxID=144538 RepID=A0A9N9FDV7_9GLOM|nr:10390_t:CDS:2 [Paraglomus brasilianum]